MQMLTVLRIMINNVRNACDEFHINQTHNSIISVIRPHLLAVAGAMGDYLVATGRSFYLPARARAAHMKELQRACVGVRGGAWRCGSGVRRARSHSSDRAIPHDQGC